MLTARQKSKKIHFTYILDNSEEDQSENKKQKKKQKTIKSIKKYIYDA